MLDFLQKYRSIFESMYFIASIGLFTSVLIGLRQLRLFKKDMDDRNRRASVEKSLEYLAIYASEIIPMHDEYELNLKKELPTLQPNTHLFDGRFNINVDNLSKEMKVEYVVKARLNLHTILNKLEFLSVGILNGLAVDDIVYTPIANHYCKLIEAEHVFISVMRSDGAPFKNLLALYRKWKSRLEVEELELQKMEVEHKIKEKGNEHLSVPPIGLGR